MKQHIFSILILFFYSNLSFAQVNEGDFLALKSIYNSTKGNDWYINSNWNINGTADDVTSDWYGITVEGGRVTKIDLAENNLDGLLPSEIENLTALKHLNIYDNEISAIGTSIGALTLLEYLNIGWNPIVVLSLDIFDLTSLTYLNLSRVGTTGLATLPSDIGNLTLLDTLDLSINNLTELPDEIWDLDSLRELDLGHNELTEIPADISNLKKLTSLSLNFNQLTTLPEEIWGLTELTSLKAHYNDIFGLSSGIGNLTALLNLDLEGNMLSVIPPQITNDTLLRIVRLGSNYIDTIPDLSDLTGLMTLTVEQNNLNFGDLEFINVDLNNLVYTKYDPQNDLLLKLTYQDNQISLEARDNGTSNVFAWYKDGTEMSGEVTNTLTVSDDDENEYYCMITNSDFPDLTIYSNMIIPAEANTYDVTFTIYDNNGIITSAGVALEGYGTLITNSMGQVTFENVSPAAYIFYTVTSAGHVEYTSVVTVTDEDVQVNVDLPLSNNSTDIKDYENPATIVSPNPTNGNFKVCFGEKTQETYTMDITDITGRTVYHRTLSDTENIISMAGQLKNGVYIVTIKNGNNIESIHKIIVKK